MYLDNAATTKMHPEVIAAMQKVSYANYNAKYYEEAQLVQNQINEAIKTIAKNLGTSKDSIVFTSGATESNNYIIKAMFELYPTKHFITSTIEHKCVLETFKFIESKGAIVTYVKPNDNGEISVEAIKNEVTENTRFISIMHVNNETGVINDISSIQELASKCNIVFHSDAVQGLGKLDFDYSKIDLLSFSGHKIHGPKGIGLAINNTRLKLPSLIHGSEQQNNNRAGTLPNELIVGLAKAIDIISQTDNNVLTKNKEYILNIFKENFGDDLIVNFERNTIDSIVSIRLKGEVNQIFLEENKESIAASTGSSCSVNNPSYVLKECGFNSEMIQETIRLSFNKFDKLYN